MKKRKFPAVKAAIKVMNAERQKLVEQIRAIQSRINACAEYLSKHS